MTAEVVFVDELPPGAHRTSRGSGRISKVGEALKANPGKWAIYGTYGSATTACAAASRLRNGTLLWAPKGSVEAQVRVVDGENRVYARWVQA